MGEPKLYSTFLLYLLSELYELLPEVGDLEKPRFVFFFDEAHLLFDDAPKALLEKLNQITRLNSKQGRRHLLYYPKSLGYSGCHFGPVRK